MLCLLGSLGLLILLLMLGYIIVEGIPFFTDYYGFTSLFQIGWQPTAENPQFGLWPMILTTLYVSFLSVLIALPIGLSLAISIVYQAPKSIKSFLLAFTDSIAGIPSVIFGFIGFISIVKALEIYGHRSSGESILAASLVLAVMILPFIITNLADSLEEGEKRFGRAALELGVSRWYALAYVVLPYTKIAILTSIIASFSRAIGETMAVMMVIGNAPILPSLFGKGETIPSLVALEMGSLTYESPHYYALYGASLVLLVIIALCHGALHYLRYRKSSNSFTS